MNDTQRAAFRTLRNAVNAEGSDTLGMINFNDRVAFTGQGSWSGTHSVTWGQLATIVDMIEELAPEEKEQPRLTAARDHYNSLLREAYPDGLPDINAILSGRYGDGQSQ